MLPWQRPRSIHRKPVSCWLGADRFSSLAPGAGDGRPWLRDMLLVWRVGRKHAPSLKGWITPLRSPDHTPPASLHFIHTHQPPHHRGSPTAGSQAPARRPVPGRRFRPARAMDDAPSHAGCPEMAAPPAPSHDGAAAGFPPRAPPPAPSHDGGVKARARRRRRVKGQPAQDRAKAGVPLPPPWQELEWQRAIKPQQLLLD